MFLKPNKRFKDGKQHIYYTLNESVRINKRRVAQRTILHLCGSGPDLYFAL